MRYHFINIIEVNILRAPFEVVDEFTRAITLLKDKGVL